MSRGFKCYRSSIIIIICCDDRCVFNLFQVRPSWDPLRLHQRSLPRRHFLLCTDRWTWSSVRSARHPHRAPPGELLSHYSSYRYLIRNLSEQNLFKIFVMSKERTSCLYLSSSMLSCHVWWHSVRNNTCPLVRDKWLFTRTSKQSFSSYPSDKWKVTTRFYL